MKSCVAKGVTATSIAFAVSAPPAFAMADSSAAIFAFKLRLSFFKEAKLAFCFSKLLPPPPQAMANKINVLVRIVEICFIIVILIFFDWEVYNFPVDFNKSTLAIKAVYNAFMKLFCALTKSACAAEISVLEPVPASNFFFVC